MEMKVVKKIPSQIKIGALASIENILTSMGAASYNSSIEKRIVTFKSKGIFNYLSFEPLSFVDEGSIAIKGSKSGSVIEYTFSIYRSYAIAILWGVLSIFFFESLVEIVMSITLFALLLIGIIRVQSASFLRKVIRNITSK